MIEISKNIRSVIRQYDEGVAITAPKGIPYTLFLSLPLFVLASYVLVHIFPEYLTGESNDYVSLVIIASAAILFGYFSYCTIMGEIIVLPQALLLPEKQKIVLRSGRTKRVISEHLIEHVTLKRGDCIVQGLGRPSLVLFTLHDTRLKKDIISIRTTGYVFKDISHPTLVDFYHEVMGLEDPEKKKYGKAASK
ncbi:hypothetical protein QA601_05975 [Chitinispirillales bacterium ANBcel5]|uniref:hypothetical protein n=1 Tax=Cellulosispirillum alkaliphilum TaxID=3039283 RepID=UPI002A5655C7|nr:hypothetical protein [Chitinispirillales bacterium ANBcel5]